MINIKQTIIIEINNNKFELTEAECEELHSKLGSFLKKSNFPQTPIPMPEWPTHPKHQLDVLGRY